MKSKEWEVKLVSEQRLLTFSHYFTPFEISFTTKLELRDRGPGG